MKQLISCSKEFCAYSFLKINERKENQKTGGSKRIIKENRIGRTYQAHLILSPKSCNITDGMMYGSFKSGGLSMHGLFTSLFYSNSSYHLVFVLRYV